MTLAHEIAEAYQQRGRSEEALTAYQDFLDNKGSEVAPETRDAQDSSESFAEDRHRLRMSATFRLERYGSVNESTPMRLKRGIGTFESSLMGRSGPMHSNRSSTQNFSLG